MPPHSPPSLEEVSHGVYAYLQRGGWGYSNAGLIASAGASLLVDTLYDLKLTARMLDEMRRREPAAASIDTLVNTHANGDHCWGNQLVGNATIVSSRAAAREMMDLSPALMATLVNGSRLLARSGAPGRKLSSLLGRLGVPRVAALSEAAELVVDCFGSFEFRGITLKLPNETFDGELTLQVGDERVQLLEVGPAHTTGDVVVYVPDARVAFTGDILFIGSHPIVWEGPVNNWIGACDKLLALDVDVIVPGHGPLTDKDGVRRIRDYWVDLIAETQRGIEAGASSDEIARDLFARPFDDWTEKSRLAVNIDTLCRELKNDRSARDPLEMFAKMARLEGKRP